MATVTEGLDVVGRVRSACGKGCDVVNLSGWCGVAIVQTVDTKWMVAQMHPPDTTPTCIVSTLGSCATLGVNAFVSFCLALGCVGGAISPCPGINQ
ncbi:MAG: hypothetical protein R2932_59220 [Caldilineaceae bacterium]